MKGWSRKIASIGMGLMLITGIGYAEEMSIAPLSEVEVSLPTERMQDHEELKTSEILPKEQKEAEKTDSEIPEAILYTKDETSAQVSDKEQKDQENPSAEELFFAEELDRRMASSGLPAEFDLREYNLVGKVRRRRNRADDSWAYAAIGAIESHIRSADFSKNWQHYSVNNLRNRAGCRMTDYGNMHRALAYFAAWKGPVLEQLDPYCDDCKHEKLPRHKSVTGAYFMSMNVDKNLNEIKHMIYENRSAVQVRIHVGEDIPSTGDPNYYGKQYYNPAEASNYVYHDNVQPNEDVVIIGWDDNYSFQNFSVRPLRNGAFICQRSKGTGFGKNGYFYLSYMDKCLNRRNSEGLMYYEAKDVDYNETLYQHDEYGMVALGGNQKGNSISFANIFERKSLQAEELRSVSFYALQDNLNYEVWVNTTGGDGELMLDPLAMKRVPIQNDKPLRRGYHTVLLKEPVGLTGRNFAVMVKLFTDKPNSVALEYKTDRLDGAQVEPGQSFIREDDRTWQDVSKDKIRVTNFYGEEEEVSVNVCLKATTKRVASIAQEPQELKDAKPFPQSGYQNVYTDKVWRIRFSEEVDESTLRDRIRIYKMGNYERMTLKLDVEENPLTKRRDTVRVILQDEKWPGGIQSKSYEPWQNYVLYIGDVKGKANSNGYRKSLEQPIKFYFRVIGR